MRLFSYVVRYDYGFAPNPFFGVCTLATCKPEIRRTAAVGDWVIGTGSAANMLTGHLVYAMNVSEALSFDQYWTAPRFRSKRPNLEASLKHAFGDNIYHRHPRTRRWVQANSHHSRPRGRANRSNLLVDTRVDRVLIGDGFTYWGGGGPKIPARFDICAQRSHRCRFAPTLVRRVVRWVENLSQGYQDEPYEFARQLDQTRI